MDKSKPGPLKKIYRPCDLCVCEGKCNYKKGCYRWKVWFSAYWRELRRQVLCIEET